MIHRINSNRLFNIFIEMEMECIARYPFIPLSTLVYMMLLNPILSLFLGSGLVFSLGGGGDFGGCLFKLFTVSVMGCSAGSNGPRTISPHNTHNG